MGAGQGSERPDVLPVQNNSPAHSGDAVAAPPSRKRLRFDAALASDSIDKKVLAELTWSGVPEGLSRSEVWQLLLAYRPLTRQRQASALVRKREEYDSLRKSLYDASPALAAEVEAEAGGSFTAGGSFNELSGNSDDEELLKQIRKDLPRTRLRCPTNASAEEVVQSQRVRNLMERVLFVWAVRQPASGYVQGLNDVLLPLLVVALVDHSGKSLEHLSADSVGNLSDERMLEIEADCYWCLTKILSEIFDHYTHGQPGIQRMVLRLKEIIQRMDAPLASHLEAQEINLFPTAFRWISCLMVRELPMSCCVRLWDTLIAESAQAGSVQWGATVGDCGSAGFKALLVYFCACFTAHFSAQLQTMDFETMTFLLQKMPTDGFTESQVEMLLGEAYVLKSFFHGAPKHLVGPEGSPTSIA